MTTDAPTPNPEPAPQPVVPAPAAAPQRPAANARSQANRNLWIAVGCLAAMFFATIVLLRPPQPATQAPATNEADVAATRAELEARRAELNRQLSEMNLPTLATRGEALDDITARIRKDSDTLISLVERSQQLVADKDRLLTEKNVELIRSEQLREALSMELTRLQASGGDSTRMAAELEAAVARATQLADELAAARRQITELSASQPADELESMKRRLDEATRARDFFELRAAELEARLRKETAPPAPQDEDTPPPEDEDFSEEP
jgi:chromosome segregation ATPase